MKQIILISTLALVLILVSPAITFGKDLLAKAENAEKLEYSFEKATLPNFDLGRVANILSGEDTSPVHIQVIENIANPTPSSFDIDNINLRILTPSTRQIIVKKKGNLKTAFSIKPSSQSNPLVLDFWLNPRALKTLIRENGGLETIAENKLTSPDFGVSFILKGTITVLNFDIDIHETITL